MPESYKTKRSFGKLYFAAAAVFFCAFSVYAGLWAYAAEGELEYTVDLNANAIPLPGIFSPNIDLSGRGSHSDPVWPQSLAAPEALDAWEKSIGWKGIYRLQYNLWEISRHAKDKQLQDKLLANYESVIKRISDAGGTVILDIFSTPSGQGKVLDKKSSPVNLKAFKEVVKGYIRELSCNKKYNVWYEVWSAPDLDNFFLGSQQEYLKLYRAVAEAVKELEDETKIHILVGGPSTSWWFRNPEGNNILIPEKSLIYGLIKFCYTYKLPLNFITWHAYSTDPYTEKRLTAYNKEFIVLIREWLSYFNFPQDIPLLVDEWNYDSGANVLPERKEKANICASFIPGRIKNMYQAGIDGQVFFSLEDFQGNKEGVVRNVGVFWFKSGSPGYQGGPKPIFAVFKMLASLYKDLLQPQARLNDEFVGAIATKGQDESAVLIYNYIDTDIFRNYLSREIALLKDAEREALLGIAKSERAAKIMRRELNPADLRLSAKVQAILRKAQEINDTAEKLKVSPRPLKLAIKGLKGEYLYSRVTLDSRNLSAAELKPDEEKIIVATDGIYRETLTLEPYSVSMVILKPKPPEPGPISQPQPSIEEPQAQTQKGQTAQTEPKKVIKEEPQALASQPEKPIPQEPAVNNTAAVVEVPETKSPDAVVKPGNGGTVVNNTQAQEVIPQPVQNTTVIQDK
ncbi:MAG: hypothetical protein WC354_05225 [Candidatus Omnitrophota bacterium]|jgi:hypothetical protein